MGDIGTSAECDFEREDNEVMGATRMELGVLGTTLLEETLLEEEFDETGEGRDVGFKGLA